MNLKRIYNITLNISFIRGRFMRVLNIFHYKNNIKNTFSYTYICPCNLKQYTSIVYSPYCLHEIIKFNKLNTYTYIKYIIVLHLI